MVLNHSQAHSSVAHRLFSRAGLPQSGRVLLIIPKWCSPTWWRSHNLPRPPPLKNGFQAASDSCL